ncbi:MAG TPA: DoxX family protein [Candidatus Dormibacteraeota bacterium]|jgi:putative oxidoreductase|nr:DoxX family protein [Candidatus Dormibacteraeota bacterium]
MHDLGRLTLRLTFGGLLSGHGLQKLGGWFGGPGLEGFAGMLESQGVRPARQWAPLAGASETAGGLLTGLGLLHPIGPIVSMAPMAVAAGTVHWGKPIWAHAGGAELALTNVAIALDQALEGPGAYSLDRLLRIRLPRRLVAAAAGLTAAGVAAAIALNRRSAMQQPAEQGDHSPATQPAGADGAAEQPEPVLGWVPSGTAGHG